MSCGHFKTGDKGQRYEISVFDQGEGKRIAVAWTNNKLLAEGFRISFEKRPSWSDVEVLDRLPWHRRKCQSETTDA